MSDFIGEGRDSAEKRAAAAQWEAEKTAAEARLAELGRVKASGQTDAPPKIETPPLPTPKDISAQVISAEANLRRIARAAQANRPTRTSS
jgi:hypothetical protein